MHTYFQCCQKTVIGKVYQFDAIDRVISKDLTVFSQFKSLQPIGHIIDLPFGHHITSRGNHSRRLFVVIAHKNNVSVFYVRHIPNDYSLVIRTGGQETIVRWEHTTSDISGMSFEFMQKNAIHRIPYNHYFIAGS